MRFFQLLLLAGCGLQVPATCAAQADTVYLDSKWEPTTTRLSDGYFRLTAAKTDSGYHLLTYYNSNGTIEKDSYYDDADGKTPNGLETGYYQSGHVRYTEHYVHGKEEGISKLYRDEGSLWQEEAYTTGKRTALRTYYPDGRLKREEAYNPADGSMTSGKIYDKKGKDLPFVPFEVYPKFNGDLNTFLSHEVHYPKLAKKAGITGRVLIKFAISEKGYVTDATVDQAVDPTLDAEALRAVKAMPRWQPGLQDGEPVKIYYTLPITFAP